MNQDIPSSPIMQDTLCQISTPLTNQTPDLCIIPESHFKEIIVPYHKDPVFNSLQVKEPTFTLLDFDIDTSSKWNIASPPFGIPSHHKCNLYLREDLPNQKIPFRVRVVYGTKGVLAILGQSIKEILYGITSVT